MLPATRWDSRHAKEFPMDNAHLISGVEFFEELFAIVISYEN
jgi:hypothetical protein